MKKRRTEPMENKKGGPVVPTEDEITQWRTVRLMMWGHSEEEAEKKAGS